jgi:hypothetical protein
VPLALAGLWPARLSHRQQDANTLIFIGVLSYGGEGGIEAPIGDGVVRWR